MNTTANSSKGFIADTPKAISAVQLVTLKHALKLESKGMKMTRGPKLRKPWAIKLGLKPMTSYEDVIAEIQKRLDAAAQDPKAQLKAM